MSKMGNSHDSNGKFDRQDQKFAGDVKLLLTISGIVSAVSGILQIFEGSIIASIAQPIFILSTAILFAMSLVGYSIGLFSKQS